MHKMLANQYFITRNYPAAVKELEFFLGSNPKDKSSRKKLIISYIQTQNVNKALVVFTDLIMEDINFIMDTDLTENYCPCPELIFEYENDFNKENISQVTLILGILWLYCNIKKSYEYFEKVLAVNPENKTVIKIINKLRTTIHN